MLVVKALRVDIMILLFIRKAIYSIAMTHETLGNQWSHDIFRQPVLVRPAEAALPIPVRGVPLPAALRQHLLQPLLGLGLE